MEGESNVAMPIQQDQEQLKLTLGKQEMVVARSDENDVPNAIRVPKKKRSLAWGHEETQNFISLRKELNGLFNSAKTNKHLWKQISTAMREKGFNRSPSMCTDKWRNLLREFKKPMNPRMNKERLSKKMSYYKEIEELTKKTNKTLSSKNPLDSKDDSRLQAPADGRNASDIGARIISVTKGEHTRRIGINGTTDGIRETIKSVFGLRTNMAFWLEDEDGVAHTIDRDMPLGNYTLHLDEGVSIDILFNDSAFRTEFTALFGEEDFQNFLRHYGWIA